jgi:hypothetical protein
MDDQHGQRTITAGMEGSDGSGNAQSRQAWCHQATHCAALTGRQGSQGYAGPHSPGEVGRLGTDRRGRIRCALMGMATQAR